MGVSKKNIWGHVPLCGSMSHRDPRLSLCTGILLLKFATHQCFHLSNNYFILRPVLNLMFTVLRSYQLPRITPSGDDIRPVPDGRVLPDSPRVLLDQGRMKARAVMTGVASEEWSRHLGFFLDDMYEANRHLGTVYTAHSCKFILKQ